MKLLTDRQIQIVDTASRLLSEHGVHGLTTKQLAKEIGFSESALYRHFSSKEDIALSLLDHLAMCMKERFSNLELSGDDPSDDLLQLFSSQFEFFNESPHYVIVVFSDGIFKESDRMKEAIKRLMDTKQSYLLPIITTGKQKQVFRNDVSTQEMMHIIMGTVRLQMYKWKSTHFEYDIRIRGKNTIESLLKLIKC